MRPRRLDLSSRAQRDLLRRGHYLAEVRGEGFAERSVSELLGWLRNLAETGAQVGTATDHDPRVRTFGYAGQATIVARFEVNTLRVLGVYFKGQDWRRHPR